MADGRGGEEEEDGERRDSRRRNMRHRREAEVIKQWASSTALYSSPALSRVIIALETVIEGSVDVEEHENAISALREEIKLKAESMRNVTEKGTVQEKEDVTMRSVDRDFCSTENVKNDSSADDSKVEVESLRSELTEQRRKLKDLINGLRDMNQDVAMWGVRESLEHSKE